MSETTKRGYILGEEWLYYKIYCGVKTSDLLLENAITPIIQKLQENSLISSWFFIRYSDPDPHIRLRFKLIDTKEIGAVIEQVKEFIAPYLEEKQVWSVKIDTYQRELERYGSNTIEISESIFHYDSELVIKTISLIESEEIYLLFILKCIESFLDQFKIKESEKLKLYESNAMLFKKEFKVNKRNITKKYNQLKEGIDTFLNNDLKEDLYPLQKILDERNTAVSIAAKNINKIRQNNNLEVSFKSLLSSYIHMFVNRAFDDKQRLYELIGYVFLHNYKWQKKNY